MMTQEARESLKQDIKKLREQKDAKTKGGAIKDIIKTFQPRDERRQGR